MFQSSNPFALLLIVVFNGFGRKPSGVFSDFFVHLSDVFHVLAFVCDLRNQPGNKLHLPIRHFKAPFGSGLVPVIII